VDTNTFTDTVFINMESFTKRKIMTYLLPSLLTLLTTLNFGITLHANEPSQHTEALKCYHAFSKKLSSDDCENMQGKFCEMTGHWDQALKHYLDAYQQNPKNSETLKNIAYHYLNLNQYDLAYLFAKQASHISPDDFEIDEILSIAAFYTPFKVEGYQAADRLILKKNISKESKELAYRNMVYYVEKLSNAKYEPIVFQLPITREGSKLHFNPMNTGIIKTDEGYLLLCRTVNYKQEGTTGHCLIDAEDATNQFKTKNYLLHYDRNFKLLSQKEIVENLPRAKFKWWNAEGVEDCRPFFMKNALWFVCTTCDTNFTGNRQMTLCKVAEEKSSENVLNVEKLVPLKGPNPRRCEKNWVPYVDGDTLKLIYSYDPFIVYKPNIETGDSEITLQYEPKHYFEKFRGSTPPIEWDGGYLLIVHEAVPIPAQQKQFYMHRFLFMDKDFVVQSVSSPFVFKHFGVEFTCGMVIDHTGKNLVIPTSVEDREAYIGLVDLETVRSMLHPLPIN
jgi:tetratricopeptide (TPR) repeat protein